MIPDVFFFHTSQFVSNSGNDFFVLDQGTELAAPIHSGDPFHSGCKPGDSAG